MQRVTCPLSYGEVDDVGKSILKLIWSFQPSARQLFHIYNVPCFVLESIRTQNRAMWLPTHPFPQS